MKLRTIAWLALVMVFFGLCGGFVADGRAQLPDGIFAIERQLGEWRGKSAYWVQEAGRVYQTNQAELAQLKENYIEAFSIANSLIDQLQLQIISGSSISTKQYASHIQRAKAASEALAAEGKRLLLAFRKPGAKSRGGQDYATQITETASQTVTLAGGILEVLDKHKKAFLEVKAKQRDEVSKVLEKRRWRPLEELIYPPREPAAKP